MNVGLFDTVLEFVLESEDLQVHGSKSNELEILESCFQLLSSITRQNKKVNDSKFLNALICNRPKVNSLFTGQACLK